MTATNNSAEWAGCRATKGASASGKYYFESRIIDARNGICRVGWSTLSDSLNLGSSATSYGFGGTGKKANKNKFEDYGEIFGKGDVIGCCLDLAAGTISYTKNGRDLGVAYSGIKKDDVYFPALLLKNCKVTVSLKEPFQFPPSGYTSIPDETPSPRPNAPRSLLALILEPTRELATQTYDCLTRFKTYMTKPELRIALVVGGERVDYRKQALELQRAHIVVATTSRFFDAMTRHRLSLDNLLFLILDEADKLVEDDANNEIMKIYNRIPARNRGNNEFRLQTCLFSATLHSRAIKELSEEICRNPLWVDLKGKDYVPDQVQQCVYYVDVTDTSQYNHYDIRACGEFTDTVHANLTVGPRVKTREEISEATKRAKLQLVKKLIDTFKMDRVIVFCRTNLDCDHLESYFVKEGHGTKLDAHHPVGTGGVYSCVVLAGMRDTASRQFALNSFRDGSVRILICTDVAARGIDIAGLPFVINLTLPDSAEQYMHRIGRVGRSDCMGLAISVVSRNEEKVWYHTCKRVRGKTNTCHNTKLTTEGGCCIWYNEMELMREIEKRVEMQIPTLTPNLGLPMEINLDGVKKGKNAKLIELAAKNAETIKQNVEILSELEYQTQASYLEMKSQML